MAEPLRTIAASPSAGEGSRVHLLWAWATDQFKKLVVVFLYLYACYAIFNLHERMVLAHHQISIAIFGLAVINAFILAKVMLLAEELHFAQSLQDYPLVLPIIVRSIAFAVLFIAFHIIEHVAVGVAQGQPLADSVPAVGGGGIGGYVAMATIMSVMLLPYFAYRELGRVMGADVLHAHLFRRKRRAEGSPRLHQEGGKVTANSRGEPESASHRSEGDRP